MDDEKDNNSIKDDISYENYKLLMEYQKDKEIEELVNNENLSLQEKIIINLKRELNSLEIEQKNILYSNEEMLKLNPNDKLIIESREVNLNIYNKNEKRIKEINQYIKDLSKNENENKNKYKKEDANDDGKKDKINDESKIKSEGNNKKDENEEILKELEL